MKESKNNQNDTRQELIKLLGITFGLQLLEFLILNQLVDLNKLTEEGLGVVIGMAMMGLNWTIACLVSLRKKE